MAFDTPNFIVGETLHDFLCLGCRHGYSNLGNLHLNQVATLDFYATLPDSFFDDRAPSILQLLSTELSLSPWRDLHTHFHDLQSRFATSLKVAQSPR
jgi:hypothetical protein